MLKRDVRGPGFRVVMKCVEGAESPTRAVRAGQSTRRSLQKERTKREQFGVMPFEWPAVFKDLAPMLDDDSFDLRLNVEIVWHARECIDNRLECFLINGRRNRRTLVLRLKYRGLFLELRLLIGLLLFVRFDVIKRDIKQQLHFCHYRS